MVRISLLAAAASAVIFGCSDPVLAQKSKDTLRYPIQEAQSTLDTYLSPGSFANLWEPSVYDNLLGFDPTKGQHVSALVKSWSQPNDRTYELELRTDVTWHDGQKFTADDVVYTLNYLIDPNVRLRFKPSWAWIKSVEKLSPTKVRVIANESVPDGLMWLSFGTPIYPKHVHEPLPGDKQAFGARPVGTGPYRIVKIDKNTGIVAEKHAGFAPGPMTPAASIGRVVSEPMDDYGTQTASLLAGKADIVVDLPIQEATALKDTGRFDILLAPPRVGYIFLQFPNAAWAKSKPLSDVRVRKAIVMAIDRKVLLDVSYGPLSSQLQPTEALCSKEQLGCGYTKMVPAYDPEGAKKLIADAGYPDGFDVAITAYRDNVADATAISGMLRKIGVLMSVKPIHSSQRLKVVQSGEVEVGYFGWSGGNMFSVAPQIVRHFQLGEYQDPEMEKLVATIPTILNDVDRRKAAAKAFDYLSDTAYAFAMVPRREIFTVTHEVMVNAPASQLRAAQISPHLFAWK